MALGAAFLVAALAIGPLEWWDLAAGLVALPTATTVLLRLRGADKPALRWTGPFGHVANIAVAVALAALMPQATLLFYGTAMIVAAVHGYAGCELFAFANRINRRDDEIGCAVLSPIDAVEARTARTKR